MYYPTASYKARFCAAGRRALQAYCTASKVDWRRIGKLIVAVDDSELPELERIKAQGDTNGVEDLTFLGSEQVHAIEPALACARALLWPGTSLVGVHGLMQALAADARAAGADIVLGSPIVGGDVTETGVELAVGGIDPGRFEFQPVINSAGFSAPAVAESLRGLGYRPLCRAHTSPRGTTLRCRGAHKFSHLIYPLPGPDGLGIHVALNMAGNLRFGPDATWVEKPDYRFDESRRVVLLSFDPSLLSRARRRGLGAWLRRCSPQAGARGSRLPRFPIPRSRGAWRGRPARPLRHRLAGADLVSCHRRRSGGSSTGQNLAGRKPGVRTSEPDSRGCRNCYQPKAL